jgi:hypothetical protein
VFHLKLFWKNKNDSLPTDPISKSEVTWNSHILGGGLRLKKKYDQFNELLAFYHNWITKFIGLISLYFKINSFHKKLKRRGRIEDMNQQQWTLFIYFTFVKIETFAIQNIRNPLETKMCFRWRMHIPICK